MSNWLEFVNEKFPILSERFVVVIFVAACAIYLGLRLVGVHKANAEAAGDATITGLFLVWGCVAVLVIGASLLGC